jgi:hypothetical protein
MDHGSDCRSHAKVSRFLSGLDPDGTRPGPTAPLSPRPRGPVAAFELTNYTFALGARDLP